MPAVRKPSPTKTPARKRASAGVKPPAKAAASRKATQAASAPAKVKPEKARKPKLVRDSFTIPKSEYAVLDELKKRASKAGLPSKKSEMLRAGVLALAKMDETAFRAALAAVPQLKTGRPKKG